MTMSPARRFDDEGPNYDKEGFIKDPLRQSWPLEGPAEVPLYGERYSWPPGPDDADTLELSRHEWPPFEHLVSSNLTIPSLIFN
jgi:hypothetical protein